MSSALLPIDPKSLSAIKEKILDAHFLKMPSEGWTTKAYNDFAQTFLALQNLGASTGMQTLATVVNALRPRPLGIPVNPDTFCQAFTKSVRFKATCTSKFFTANVVFRTDDGHEMDLSLDPWMPFQGEVLSGTLRFRDWASMTDGPVTGVYIGGHPSAFFLRGDEPIGMMAFDKNAFPRDPLSDNPRHQISMPVEWKKGSEEGC